MNYASLLNGKTILKTMTYKEELFNALEQFLIDNNIYSQFTTYVLEHFNIDLLEFCNRYFEDSGGLDYLFYDY